MANLVVKCPYCSEFFQMPEEFMGKMVVCPRCKYKVDTGQDGLRVTEKEGDSTAKLSTASLLEKGAENRGEQYTNGDIAFILLFENCGAAEILLADVLGRTPGAINFILRWQDKQVRPNKRNFNRKSFNRIKRQIRAARKKLGSLVGFITEDNLRTFRPDLLIELAKVLAS